MEFRDLVRFYLWISGERPLHFCKRAGIDPANFGNWQNGKPIKVGAGVRSRIRRAMLDQPPNVPEIVESIYGFQGKFNALKETEGKT